MAGRFEGLSDWEWKLFEDIFPTSQKRARGMPHTPFRNVLNSLQKEIKKIVSALFPLAREVVMTMETLLCLNYKFLEMSINY